MLTKRQAEILDMFLRGWSGRAIALNLGLSPETINPSLKQTARRLGAGGIGREKLRAAVAQHGGDVRKLVVAERVSGQTGDGK